ncbi:signal peptide peptidase SppA [Halobacteriales archaeon QH_10_67_13]|nr:MAG: signal peptide peptidase SppA [Halobacteriales archaeon QH_10_67_13]
MSNVRSLGRLAVVLIGTGLAVGVGIGVVWGVPAFTELSTLDAVVVAAVGAAGVGLAGRFATDLFPAYNVAEVEVGDVITRDGAAGPLPGSGGASADEIVEQIERADADDSAQGLIVKLNTPGGEVVPSEDIRRAAAEFDGPTVAYAEDIAASGGYWIASGCDEFHARETSLVGSIGVNGTQLGRTGLAEKAGLEYRRFVAGEYKDSPSPWRELEDRRELEEAFVRDTEARVYIGEEAAENGLVDACGPRPAMEARLADRLGVDELRVETFEPQRGVTDRLGAGARSVAYALGAGAASALLGDDGPRIRT